MQTHEVMLRYLSEYEQSMRTLRHSLENDRRRIFIQHYGRLISSILHVKNVFMAYCDGKDENEIQDAINNGIAVEEVKSRREKLNLHWQIVILLRFRGCNDYFRTLLEDIDVRYPR
jgi:hypothetical protein